MDLTTGTYLWQAGLEPPKELPARTTTSVAVVGAGVTAALIADQLTEIGCEVTAIDKRLPATGSTRASTAIIDYSLDVLLTELGEHIGEERAEEVYRAMLGAVGSLRRVCGGFKDSLGFVDTASLMLAYDEDEANSLRAEMEARLRSGFSASLLGASEIGSRYPWAAAGGLYHRDAATIDPVRLTESLWKRMLMRGASLYTGAALKEYRESRDSVDLLFTGGRRVTCERVILACGYESKRFLPDNVGTLTSSYAAATAPGIEIDGWEDDAVIWEVRRPYLYLRRSADRRVIIGGNDKPFHNTLLRDALLPWERHQLAKSLRKLLKRPELALERTWCGTFAESSDGLPSIGALPKSKRVFAAFGSGGNGIVAAALARSLAASWVSGAPHPLEELFAIDRPSLQAGSQAASSKRCLATTVRSATTGK